MDKRKFNIAMAIEIPIAFIVLTLLLNNRSDVIFYIAWAAYAVVVSAALIFIKKVTDETKKAKLRRKFARMLLAFILIGAAIVVAVVAVFVIAFSLGL